jgi:hypothetical protein
MQNFAKHSPEAFKELAVSNKWRLNKLSLFSFVGQANQLLSPFWCVSYIKNRFITQYRLISKYFRAT